MLVGFALFILAALIASLLIWKVIAGPRVETRAADTVPKEVVAKT
jgi:hypothetical protein